jgi:peptidoglycan/xylan/chitin deacetylase (PgdA/CDA1 family)
VALSKRALLAVWASRLRVLRILESVRKRPCLLVLNYHRIAEPALCQYDRGVIEASPGQFDEQINWLKRQFHVAELDEVCELAADPRRLRQCTVLVSLDDGYRDNYEVALPILRSHGVRAAFFLPTAFVGSAHVPWWDQIAFAVRSSSRRRLLLRYPRDISLSISDASPEPCIRQLLRIYKEDAMRDPERFLGGIAEACDVDLPRTAQPPLFMTWAEAAQLARAGMGIGSHGHEHELLAKGSAEKQLLECHTSRTLLREKVGIDPTAFAYPVGSRASFSSVTKECLRESGYRIGLSNYGGVNTPEAIDPFDLRRMGLDRAMTMSEFRLQATVAGLVARAPW